MNPSLLAGSAILAYSLGSCLGLAAICCPGDVADLLRFRHRATPVDLGINVCMWVLVLTAVASVGLTASGVAGLLA